MSNYGYINDDTIKNQIQLICKCLGNGKNDVAHLLLYETAKAETGLGSIEDKTIGAGIGICQFDKFPFNDLKKRSLTFKDKILKDLGVDITKVDWDDLRYNIFLSLLFARLLYWLKGEPIPKTIEERASYWKLHYNTKLGKGTVEHYLEMNKIYGVKINYQHLTEVKF